MLSTYAANIAAQVVQDPSKLRPEFDQTARTVEDVADKIRIARLPQKYKQAWSIAFDSWRRFANSSPVFKHQASQWREFVALYGMDVVREQILKAMFHRDRALRFLSRYNDLTGKTAAAQKSAALIKSGASPQSPSKLWVWGGVLVIGYGLMKVHQASKEKSSGEFALELAEAAMRQAPEQLAA